MIDYGLFRMIYKPSKSIYSSVHIERVYHFIRDHFSRIPLYTYISFNGPLQIHNLALSLGRLKAILDDKHLYNRDTFSHTLHRSSFIVTITEDIRRERDMRRFVYLITILEGEVN